MSQGHDHHLTAAHLRGFSTPTSVRQIWMMDLRNDRTRLIGVRDAGVKRGLNTVRAGPMQGRELERFMDLEIEQHAAPVLRRLREMPTGLAELSPFENRALSRYIALAYARSPRNRERSAEHARSVALQMARQLEHPGEFLRQLEQRGYRVNPVEAEAVRVQYWTELQEGVIPEAVPIWPITVETALKKPPLKVQVMSKVVVRRGIEPYMIVGDCPVLLARDGGYYAWGGLGFGVSGVRLFVPLSPTAVLICAPLSARLMLKSLGAWAHEDFAAFVNAGSIAHAHRFAYAADSSHLSRARESHTAASDAAARMAV